MASCSLAVAPYTNATLCAPASGASAEFNTLTNPKVFLTSLVYSELSGLVKKTFGLVSVLNSALAPLAGALSVAFVYGATAKEQEAMETNVELLLIGDNTSYGELLSRLPVAERILRRKINPNLYSVPDFRRRLREQQPFILQVLHEQKIYVLGDETNLDFIKQE